MTHADRLWSIDPQDPGRMPDYRGRDNRQPGQEWSRGEDEQKLLRRGARERKISKIVRRAVRTVKRVLGIN